MRQWWVAMGMAVALFACKEGTEETVVPVELAEAGRLYQQKCALCHGGDGRLKASGAPDLTLSTMNHAERTRIIRYGKGLMPPQGNVLSAGEIAGIAQFLDAFHAAE